MSEREKNKTERQKQKQRRARSRVRVHKLSSFTALFRMFSVSELKAFTATKNDALFILLSKMVWGEDKYIQHQDLCSLDKFQVRQTQKKRWRKQLRHKTLDAMFKKVDITKEKCQAYCRSGHFFFGHQNIIDLHENPENCCWRGPCWGEAGNVRVVQVRPGRPVRGPRRTNLFCVPALEVLEVSESPPDDLNFSGTFTSVTGAHCSRNLAFSSFRIGVFDGC